MTRYNGSWPTEWPRPYFGPSNDFTLLTKDSTSFRAVSIFLHKSSKQEGFCRGLIRSDVKRGQSGRGKVSDKGSVRAREGGPKWSVRVRERGSELQHPLEFICSKGFLQTGRWVVCFDTYFAEQATCNPRQHCEMVLHTCRYQCTKRKISERQESVTRHRHRRQIGAHYDLINLSVIA